MRHPGLAFLPSVHINFKVTWFYLFAPYSCSGDDGSQRNEDASVDDGSKRNIPGDGRTIVPVVGVAKVATESSKPCHSERKQHGQNYFVRRRTVKVK